MIFKHTFIFDNTSYWISKSVVETSALLERIPLLSY